LIVLDASLALAWLLGESGSPSALNVREMVPDVPFTVPSHWPVEVANVLSTEVRKGNLSPSDFHIMMDQLDQLDIRVEPPMDLDEVGPLAQFAVSCRLTAYDAAYVQLALSRRTMLATLDNRMRAAATALNVLLLPA
jgi:predicted nucleic acid-binding protein